MCTSKSSKCVSQNSCFKPDYVVQIMKLVNTAGDGIQMTDYCLSLRLSFLSVLSSLVTMRQANCMMAV